MEPRGHATLRRQDLGKGLDAEAPAMKTATEGHIAQLWAYLEVTHGGVVVGRLGNGWGERLGTTGGPGFWRDPMALRKPANTAGASMDNLGHVVGSITRPSDYNYIHVLNGISEAQVHVFLGWQIHWKRFGPVIGAFVANH